MTSRRVIQVIYITAHKGRSLMLQTSVRKGGNKYANREACVTHAEYKELQMCFHYIQIRHFFISREKYHIFLLYLAKENAQQQEKLL